MGTHRKGFGTDKISQRADLPRPSAAKSPLPERATSRTPERARAAGWESIEPPHLAVGDGARSYRMVLHCSFERVQRHAAELGSRKVTLDDDIDPRRRSTDVEFQVPRDS